MPQVKVKKLVKGAYVPTYESAGAAGADLRACLEKTLTLGPGERFAVPTGLALEIPAGYEGQVRPRSGLALKYGLSVPNAPGTIDSDYRGELKVILINLGKEPIEIRDGERIAQLVIAPVVQCEFTEDGELSATARGGGGFGSTGKT